jgi:uncharacterized membrane protein YoaK (UPF0700 family)
MANTTKLRNLDILDEIYGVFVGLALYKSVIDHENIFIGLMFVLFIVVGIFARDVIDEVADNEYIPKSFWAMVVLIALTPLAFLGFGYVISSELAKDILMPAAIGGSLWLYIRLVIRLLDKHVL